MPLCDSKQGLLRQQAGASATASRRHRDSKQVTNAATLSVCHILHFAFDLRSSLLPLGKVHASMTFLSLTRSLCK